jgi:hypothetical protein
MPVMRTIGLQQSSFVIAAEALWPRAYSFVAGHACDNATYATIKWRPSDDGLVSNDGSGGH